MLSPRSVLLAITVLTAAPLSLAAPPVADENSVAHHEQRSDVDDTPYEQRDVEMDDDVVDDELASDADVNDVLSNRNYCYTTNRRGLHCVSAQCRGKMWCMLSPTSGRCVWREKNPEKRPIACQMCRCAKFKKSEL